MSAARKITATTRTYVSNPLRKLFFFFFFSGTISSSGADGPRRTGGSLRAGRAAAPSFAARSRRTGFSSRTARSRRAGASFRAGDAALRMGAGASKFSSGMGAAASSGSSSENGAAASSGSSSENGAVSSGSVSGAGVITRSAVSGISKSSSSSRTEGVRSARGRRASLFRLAPDTGFSCFPIRCPQFKTRMAVDIWRMPMMFEPRVICSPL